jgi:hypothetical protein
MAMVKRANGRIEKFTDNDGDEVKTEQVNSVVWADEKEQPIKDELSIPNATDVDLDIDAVDDGDDVVAKNC